MKLSQKGRFAPPPPLPQFAEAVSRTLAGWPAVHARTHWRLGDESIIDGADFYLGDHPNAEELGHLHLYSEAHVVLPRKVVSALLAAGLGERFPWSSAIVSYRVNAAAAVAHALWLFQLRYDDLRGANPASLLKEVEARGGGVRHAGHAQASGDVLSP